MSDFQKNFLANKPLMSSVIGAGSMVVLQKYLNAPSGTIKLPFTEMRVAFIYGWSRLRFC